MKAFFSSRGTQAAVLAIGVLTGMILWHVLPLPNPHKTIAVDPARVKAWEKVVPRLRQADESGAKASDQYLQRIHEFFAEKKRCDRAFAEDLLGWGGKWAFVKGKLTGDDGKNHQAFIQQAFRQHFFTDNDVKNLLQSVITGYLSELEGQENALLVTIRADLKEEDLPALQQQSILNSDKAFLGEYRKKLVQVSPLVGRDLKITIGREAVVWVGSDVAAIVTVRIASAVAVRLGVSGGILGTGAASGVATLGVGLLAGFVVDGVVDVVMRKAGYDPAGEIARQVSGMLGRIENLVLDGDPEAHGIYKQLRRMQDADSFSFVRGECRQNADRIDCGGSLGLRHELNRLQRLRNQLREAALKKLILEGSRS